MSTATVTAAMQSVASQTFTVKADSKTKKKYVEATPEILALVKRHVDLQAREKALAAEREEIRDVLAGIMLGAGANQIRHQGSTRATRSVSTPRRLDTETFEAAHPGLLDQYKVPGDEVERVTVK